MLLATIAAGCLLYIALAKETKRTLFGCTLMTVVATAMVVLLELARCVPTRALH